TVPASGLTTAPAAPALPVGEGAVVSPLAGTVVKLAVANGQSVAIGDVLVVLEAMKMNTPIAATRAGQVTAIAVAVGTTVSEGQVLLTLG
ncbi:acetyl-CoA carboxylase biotin carboxyl carrier protein subunit, partial [Rhodospirillum rubrum]|nr:acetyl-CoA carboxylase biotin carboxyl carrier protein subunit [Rhodospirillum rubrum]